MKRILQCEQAPLGFMSVVVLRASVGAGELQRSFPCLSAAVAEECFLKSRELSAGHTWAAVISVPSELQQRDSCPDHLRATFQLGEIKLRQDFRLGRR